MIKLVKIEEETPDRRTCILYSDTKTEVPEHGADTVVLSGPLGPGSVIYTANLEIAVLKSDDTWNWLDS